MTLRTISTQQPFNFNGIYFTDCNAKAQFSANSGISVVDVGCDIKLTNPGIIHIARLNDGGILYTIVNDSVCDHTTFNPYPTGLKLVDMDVENLPSSYFCSVYLSQ